MVFHRLVCAGKHARNGGNMYYNLFESGVQRVSLEEINEENVSIGYLSLEDFSQHYSAFGLSKTWVEECRKETTHFGNRFEVYDNFSFGLLNIMDLEDVRNSRDRVAFFLKKKLLLLVELEDEDESIHALFEEVVHRIRQKVTLERVVYDMFLHLINNGNAVLECAEQQIIEMERDLLDKKTKSHINHKIFDIKNNLMLRRRYYEELVDIGESLQENENNIFMEDSLRYFKIFTDKAKRLSDNTQLLCEAVVHLRETYEAALDYSLNSTMKLFTVVTTIFLPLSLIVGWYGMNFNMPELNWEWGYLYVGIFSIAVVILCLWLFKKKKFF